jgi:DNA-binding SARP family transcriptional activator
LSLLGGFSLCVGGDTVALPRHARRVLAFLSLDKVVQRDCDRGVLAERLWTDAPMHRARGSLRTALWRIRKTSPVLVTEFAERISLGAEVDVDALRFRADAERVLSGHDALYHTRLACGSAVLLPGWDEEWLLLAREQLRQLRLHALEAAGHCLIQRGRHQEAIDVMLGVVADEPLRESRPRRYSSTPTSETATCRKPVVSSTCSPSFYGASSGCGRRRSCGRRLG